MSPRSNILFVATQFGSFNMLYPILMKCMANYGVGYMGISAITGDGLILNRTIGENDHIPSWVLERYNLVVTGTSHLSEVEYDVWREAAKRNIGSVCVLDSSKGCGDRFIKNGSAVYPDVICVVDEKAVEALIDLGAPKERIVVTGSPYLEAVNAFRLSVEEREQQKKVASPEGKKIVTFCTEYLAKSGEAGRYGYDELTILRDLLLYIDQRGPGRFKLLIKLHPNDSAGIYNDFMQGASSAVDWQVVYADTEKKFLQISDVVVGMTSVILTEALMLDLPVVSYQPVTDAGMVHYAVGLQPEFCVTSRDAFFTLLDNKLSPGNRMSDVCVEAPRHGSLNALMKVIDRALPEQGDAAR